MGYYATNPDLDAPDPPDERDYVSDCCGARPVENSLDDDQDPPIGHCSMCHEGCGFSLPVCIYCHQPDIYCICDKGDD